MSKETDYLHLNSQTKKIMNKSQKIKIQWVRKDHFVRYANANKILNYFEWIISQPQEPNVDLDSMSLIGESGTGKTSIVNQFKKDHSFSKNMGDYETHTVAHCILTDADLGLKGLYISILKAEPFNYPLTISRLRRYTTVELELSCIELLKKSNVKILFVDEIQHALGRNQSSTLNSLKRVVLSSGVPLVPVGTENAETVLKMDPQLSDRCPVKSFSKLEPWKKGREFRSFLAGYEMFLPFPEPSNLKSKNMSDEIYLMATNKENEPNLRRISRIIKGVASLALVQEASNITMEHLNTYKEDFQ